MTSFHLSVHARYVCRNGLALILMTRALASQGADIDLAPNRLQFFIPSLLASVSADNSVLLVSGTRRFCAHDPHGRPKQATLYAFDPSAYAGSPPVITADTSPGCFRISAALSKSCKAGDEACFRALPVVTAAFQYATTTVEQTVVISPPPPPPADAIPVVTVTLKNNWCTARNLAEARVCSLPGQRLAHVTAQVEPAPETLEGYDLIPDYKDPKGPCVTVTARGSGKKVGIVYIPIQFPVTANSPKLPVDACERYAGGELRIRSTYSQVNPLP